MKFKYLILPLSFGLKSNLFKNFAVVPCILILLKFFYLPTDAQENYFKKNIKIYIKTIPSCFGAITIIRSVLFEIAKVTVVKIIN